MKSVDPAAGVVVVTTGAGPTAKTVTVHITKTTVLKRYAANSIRFADAQPAPLDAIHAGDQFQVLGQKNADGTEITAAEVVSGSFRNISGVVASIDPAASTLTVKDLVTKKNVTVHITPDAEMRRLPDTMAKMIAARLKGGAAGAAPGGGSMMPAHAEGGGAAGNAPAGPGPKQWNGSRPRTPKRWRRPQSNSGTRASGQTQRVAERRSGNAGMHRRHERSNRDQAAGGRRTTAGKPRSFTQSAG